jgi:phospholipid/cholesterol/gamma-HCH transport system substrate-binding protein
VKIKVTPEFQSSSLAFRAGLVVLVVLAGLLYITFKAQSGMPFATTTEVQARFENVHSLRTNDAVRQNSKRIGRVSKVAYSDGGALVTMKLDGNVRVHQDSHAAIWDLSALATKFIELDPGTPAAGSLRGAVIPASQTEASADLYQLLDALDPRTRAAATSTLREVGSGTAGHSDDLASFLEHSPEMLDNIGRVSQALAAPGTDLVGVLERTDALVGRLDGREEEIASLVVQTDRTLSALAVDSGQPLGETVEKLPGTLAGTKAAMDALSGPLDKTGAAMTALQPGAAALGSSEKDLRGFLREAVPVAAQVPGVAEQAGPALVDLTDTMADARPLVPRLREAIASLMTPLQVLAPYTTDMAQLFLRGASFVSQGPEPGVRYARLGLTPGVNTVTGGLLPSGNLPLNEYPAPGKAQHDRAEGLPTGLPGLPLRVNR